MTFQPLPSWFHPGIEKQQQDNGEYGDNWLHCKGEENDGNDWNAEYEEK